MTRVLVLYYSSYGHVRALAQAEAEGARSMPGTRVDLRRVPETILRHWAACRNVSDRPELVDIDAMRAAAS